MLRLTANGPTADPQPRCHLRDIGLGCSRFARHYYGNHSLFSLPQGTEMFHFPWFAPLGPMNSGRGCRSYSPRRVSPFGYLRINARLATPRSFSQPPTSFIASWHLGIHHTPLVAYLPSSLAHAPCNRWFVEARDQGPGPCSSQQTRLSQFSPDRCCLKAAEVNSSQQKLISTLRMQLSKNARV